MRSDRGEEYYSRYTEDGQALGPFVKFLQKKWDCCPIHLTWFSRPKWYGRKKKLDVVGHSAQYAK